MVGRAVKGLGIFPNLLLLEIKNMKKLTLLIILFVAFNFTALACGAPQIVHGQAVNTSNNGISNAFVTLSDGENVRTALTNQFGFYNFYDVTPCLSYQISIQAKGFVFIKPVRYFYVAGDAEGYEINWVGYLY